MRNYKLMSIINKKQLAYLIFLIALIVRLTHIAEISYRKPYYQVLYTDAKVLDKWGQEIAAGNIIAKGLTEQDPIYGYFLGLIYSIFGHNLFIVVLIQGIMGSLSSVLIFLIGRSLVNSSVGLIAAILWIFHPPIIFFEGLLLKEGLAVFLILSAIYSLILARESKYYRHWFFGGVFLGMAALTRGNVLFMVPFIFFWLIFEHGIGFIRYATVLLLGIATLFFPVALKNKLATGEFAITGSRAGISFYWGNNEVSLGSFNPAPSFVRVAAGYEHDDFAREAVRLTGREMTNSEISRFWFKKGLNFIYNNPSHYLWLQYQKLRLLLSNTELSDNLYEYYYLKRFSTIVNYSPANFWLIASLGLLGMFIAINDWKSLSLLYIFVISYSMSLMIFFVTSRYRLPMSAVLTIFAAYSIDWSWKKIKEKNYQPIVVTFILFTTFVYFTTKDIPWVITLNSHEVLIDEANELVQKGDYETALNKYRKAIELFPNSYGAYVGLGGLYHGKKLYYEAIQSYKAAIESMPRSPFAHFMLGMTYLDANKLDDAIKELQTSIALDPDRPSSYYCLALAFEKKGMNDESLTYWNEFLKRDSKSNWSDYARKKIEILTSKSNENR